MATSMAQESPSSARARTAGFAGLVLLGVIVALVFGPDGPLGGFWRPEPGPEPTGAMIAGFIGVSVAEGLALGAALGILVLGRGWFTRVITNQGLAVGAWLSSVFLLGSWWPHTAVHRHFGADPANLLWIEWVFHVGSMVMIGVLIYGLVTAAARTRTSVREA